MTAEPADADGQQAEAALRRLLEREPGNGDALRRLGLLAMQAGRHEAAVDYFRQALAAGKRGAMGDGEGSGGQPADDAACHLDLRGPLTRPSPGGRGDERRPHPALSQGERGRRGKALTLPSPKGRGDVGARPSP
jgi:tetratricopeptide (TPR) repeat protein